MRSYLLISIVLSVIYLPLAAHAEVRLFNGNLEIITTSGKACGALKGKHAISLVIGGDETNGDIFGYEGGDTVTVGMLKGAALKNLVVRYPYPDAERAEGHTMQLEINGKFLIGELRDRHINDATDDCNFDLARIKLQQIEDETAANAAYKRLSTLYEAQLLRSTALSYTRRGDHAAAVGIYEKALALADTLYPADSEKLVTYITTLANSYILSGRYSDLSLFYNQRFESVHNKAVKTILNHNQIRALLQVGRAALGREDYATALYNFRQALRIDYKNKDAIAATMSALVRSGRHDEAITFLEETEQKLESEPDRKDVRGAIALVEYQKAIKEHKAGRIAEAERDLRKAIKLDSGTAYYLIVLARWTHKAGRYYEADSILKRGADLFKDAAGKKELIAAREKLRLTEQILAGIRKAGE